MVATRTADEPLAQKMEYFSDGTLDLASVSDMDKKVGTTVAVVQLHQQNKVRRRDLVRGIEDQRQKLIKVLQGYAIFSTGVRFQLIDIVGSDCQERILISTGGGAAGLRENISSVLGGNVLNGMAPLDVQLHPDDATWSMQGYISSIQHNSSSHVVAMCCFAINRRPVEIPKLRLVIKAIWKAHGGTKRPSSILHLTLPDDAFDINIGPGERQVIFKNESIVLQAVEQVVAALWAEQTGGQRPLVPPRDAIESRSAVGYDFENMSDSSDEGDGNEQLDALSPSGQFRRRYAFSHDFRTARLQHEYDDGRDRRSLEHIPMRRRVTVETSRGESMDDDEDGGSHKKRKSMDDASWQEAKRRLQESDNAEEQKVHAKT